MRKLALLATVAMVVSAPAMAREYHHSKHPNNADVSGSSNYELRERNMRGETLQLVETRTRVLPKRVLEDGTPDFSGRYALLDGNLLTITGTTAMLSDGDGSGRFYAPTSGYKVRNGSTIFVEQGKFMRIEDAPQIVYVDSKDIIQAQ